MTPSRFIQYASVFGYSGFNSADRVIFDAVAGGSIETAFEPTDLTVSQNSAEVTYGAEVQIAPLDPAVNPPFSGLIAQTTCVNPGSNYGAHHHRVCQLKQITIYRQSFDSLTFFQQTYIMNHEFGHAVGLRHANPPCGDLDNSCIGTLHDGTAQWNTHPDGGGSVMHTGGFAATNVLHAHDRAHINEHY